MSDIIISAIITAAIGFLGIYYTKRKDRELKEHELNSSKNNKEQELSNRKKIMIEMENIKIDKNKEIETKKQKDAVIRKIEEDLANLEKLLDNCVSFSKQGKEYSKKAREQFEDIYYYAKGKSSILDDTKIRECLVKLDGPLNGLVNEANSRNDTNEAFKRIYELHELIRKLKEELRKNFN